MLVCRKDSTSSLRFCLNGYSRMLQLVVVIDGGLLWLVSPCHGLGSLRRSMVTMPQPCLPARGVLIGSPRAAAGSPA